MIPYLQLILQLLVIAGAINWGLIGLFNLNLVQELDKLISAKGILARIIYILVGIAGVIYLVELFRPGLLL